MYDPERVTFFAETDARGQHVKFGIKAKDRTRHVYVIGKTGMGKSTLLENMAIQDIQNGEGLAFIDPHGQTAEKLLDYIPEERVDDLLYFAPFDMEYPVSFNVMEDVGPDKRHLVVSGLMSVFEKIWVDAWSARMAYILQNTLLALLEYPDSTLLGVNQMLSNKAYREKVVDNISDPAVKSFWVDEFANYNERYMQEAGDAIKNKIGQFTSNPLIRNIIGQPKSSFDLRNIMDDQKIIIMNLSKGLVGESNANLLGSMLTTRIYLAAMSRADLPLAELNAKPNFYFYVDEFQSFANATFANILSESRKYKLNLTIAHQYIEQMEEEVKNAVFGNVGTVIAFRVGPFDAEVLETIFAPRFYAADICNLGFAQVYLTLMIDGIGSAPFSAVTLPPIEPGPVSHKNVVVHRSRGHYAKARSKVEEMIAVWHREREEESASSRKKKKGSGGSNDKKSSGGPQKNTNGAHANQTPKHQEKPHTQQKPKEPQPHELRSVLAGIAGAEVKSDATQSKSPNTAKQHTKSPETPSKHNSTPTRDTTAHEQRSRKTESKQQKSKPPHTHSHEQKHTNTKSPKTTDSDAKNDLRAALAGVLGNTNEESNNAKRTQKRAFDTKKEPATQQETRSEKKREDTASDDTPEPSKNELKRMMRVSDHERPPLS